MPGFYVQLVIIYTVKSRQISNILTRGFLLMCKNRVYSATDQSKSQKKINENIELELY